MLRIISLALMLAAHTSHPVKLSLPNLLQYIYRPQRSWGKVIFSQVCVILFTGGCMLGCPPGADTPPREQTLPPEQTPPWEQTPPMLGDTVNVWAVCILLECKLFHIIFYTLNFKRCITLGQMSANSHYFLHLSCFHS